MQILIIVLVVMCVLLLRALTSPLEARARQRRPASPTPAAKDILSLVAKILALVEEKPLRQCDDSFCLHEENADAPYAHLDNETADMDVWYWRSRPEGKLVEILDLILGNRPYLYTLTFIDDTVCSIVKGDARAIPVEELGAPGMIQIHKVLEKIREAARPTNRS